MAAASYTTDLTSVTDAQSGTWVELTGATGGSSPVNNDTDYFIEGTGCTTQASRKTGTQAGFVFDYGSNITLATDEVFTFWQVYLASNAIDTYANGGLRAGIGSANGDSDFWTATGSDSYRNPYGGWWNTAIDPTSTPDFTLGTPGGTYRWFATWTNNVSAVSKGNMVACDAIYYGRAEFIVTDGDLGNGYATVAGMATTNDGQTNRWGLMQVTGISFLWKGLWSLGTAATSVDFRDSNRVIEIQDTPATYASFTRIEVNHASSNVEWNAINISGPSLSPAGTILVKGQFEAIANATIAKNTCVFTDMDTFIYQSNSTLTGCTYRRCGLVTQGAGTFTSCAFDEPSGAVGLLATTLTPITNCIFKSNGTGHGIEISVSGTYNFDANEFIGYGVTGTTDAMIYNNSGGLVTINILNGGTVVSYRNGTSATTVVNNAVQLLIQGVTEGAACVMIANETVGTITVGDVLLEDLADSNGEATAAIDYEAAFEPTGLDVITRVRASGLPTAAIQDDNGVFTDETTAANSAVAADMNLLPATAVVNQDRYLFGHSEMFNKMKLAINTAGTGGFTITWQYWNGTWTNLSGVVDDTSSFSVTGTNYISFTMPGDWTTTTVNGQGPYYYIRAAYTAGTVTVSPVGTRCSLDVNKYLPFVQDGTVTSAGLSVTVSWVRDTIATF